MLELHCHTTRSDGTLTPTALVAAAISAGVKALAITDHDTLAGWDEAEAAAGEWLEIIPGVELSTVYNGRSLHILGFYPERAKLAPRLATRLAGRRRRAQAMADKLAELGCPIELPALTDGMAPGRPPHCRSLSQGWPCVPSPSGIRSMAGGRSPGLCALRQLFCPGRHSTAAGMWGCARLGSPLPISRGASNYGAARFAGGWAHGAGGLPPQPQPQR
jgi:hypothetical protein